MSGATGSVPVPVSAQTVPGWPPRFELAAEQILTRHLELLGPWLRRDVELLDADAAHDFRVTLRRLDSTLRLLRPLASPALLRLRRCIHSVSAALGEVRDLDEQLRLLEAGEALRAVLLGRRRTALRRLRAVMREAAAPRWPARLERLLRSPDCWRSPLARQPARPVASALIRERRRNLRRSLERLDRHAPLARSHRARRRAKRYDDALADFEPWLGDAARPLRRDLGRLRSALGALQDAVVAERDYGELALRSAANGALRQRARELSASQTAVRERALRRALRAARAMSPAHWRRVRDALGRPACLEEPR
jgi:CHAD domain-containing protein